MEQFVFVSHVNSLGQMQIMHLLVQVGDYLEGAAFGCHIKKPDVKRFCQLKLLLQRSHQAMPLLEQKDSPTQGLVRGSALHLVKGQTELGEHYCMEQ